MNKFAKRIAAALLSQAMLLSAAAFAEAPAAEAPTAETAAVELSDDTPVMTVNGRVYTVYDFKAAAYYLYSNQYTQSPTDYPLTYSFLVQDEMYRYGIAKLGMDQFTEEEEAAFAVEAQTEWDAAIRSYVDYYKTGSETEEELAVLEESAVAYWTSMGYSLEDFAEELKMGEADKRLRDHIISTYGLGVSREDIETQFAALVEEDRSIFEENPAMYEIYQNYYQYESFYIPNGYRGVLQILLAVDETLLNDYTNKLTAYESQQAAAAEPTAAEPAAEETAATETTAEEPAVTEPAATEPTTEETAAEESAATEPTAEETEAAETDAAEPVVTLEEVEAAREAALASVQGTIDEIYTRLENGESFISLIPEYNIDPGMQSEEYLASGYLVHKDSVIYDPAFINAAFDENMTAVGGVSAPALGQYGVYIVYYLRDAGGPVELTDSLYSSLENDIISTRLNQKFSELITEWQAESEITYEAETFTALTGLQVVDGQVIFPESNAQ